jgi:hypothetical protein
MKAFFNFPKIKLIVKKESFVFTANDSFCRFRLRMNYFTSILVVDFLF